MPFSVWFNHIQIISRPVTITSDYLFTEDNITDNNNSVNNNILWSWSGTKKNLGIIWVTEYLKKSFLIFWNITFQNHLVSACVPKSAWQVFPLPRHFFSYLCVVTPWHTFSFNLFKCSHSLAFIVQQIVYFWINIMWHKREKSLMRKRHHGKTLSHHSCEVAERAS